MLFSKYAGNEIKIGDEKLLVMHESDIMLIVEALMRIKSSLVKNSIKIGRQRVAQRHGPSIRYKNAL